VSLHMFRKLAAEAAPIKVVDPNPGVDAKLPAAARKADLTRRAADLVDDRTSFHYDNPNMEKQRFNLRSSTSNKANQARRNERALGAASKANKWQQLAQLAPGVAGQAAGTASVLTRMVPEKYRDGFQAGALRNLQGQAEGAADVAGHFISSLGDGIKRTTPLGNAGKHLRRVGEFVSGTWPLGNN